MWGFVRLKSAYATRLLITLPSYLANFLKEVLPSFLIPGFIKVNYPSNLTINTRYTNDFIICWNTNKLAFKLASIEPIFFMPSVGNN